MGSAIEMPSLCASAAEKTQGTVSYVAFDLETTGLRPSSDRILEIGAVRVEDGEVTGTYETLVDHALPIPERITELTGITEEMTAGAPDIREAVEGFLRFSGDAVLLGHNIQFDYGFMKRNVLNLRILQAAGEEAGNRPADSYSYERMGLDTLTIARTVLPQLKSKSLDKLADWYQIPLEHHHRAMDDALTAARLFERLREEFARKYPALFEPVPLQSQVRRENPITSSQKAYLRELIKYHRIESAVKIDLLTKNEASRMIDGIILHYGKIGSRP
ncbi:MAG: 3'-5' exonuclease [Lachnospiraceae bacterium]|nr:3'-5' exonuclease [Lachnospiraceae bacterium]